MTLEKEMESKLLMNIMDELKYVQDYTFASLRYEATKGIQTGFYCLGYFGEKMTSLEKSVHRIESWLEMLHRGSISQPPLNYCPNCGGLAESVYAGQRYPPKAYSSEIVEFICCPVCGIHQITPLSQAEEDELEERIKDEQEENEESDEEVEQ